MSMLLLVLLMPGITGCKKQAFFAGREAVITLTAEATTIGLNESVTISIIGYNTDGSLLWDGTRVDFTIENGSLDQSTVELKDGKAMVTATGNMERGEMKITARSGNAVAEPNPLVITVGETHEVSQIIAALNPAILPYEGGRVEITARIYDADFEPIPGVSVVMESDSGMLDSQGTPLTTNDAGTVTDYLETTAAGTVTIYAGDKTRDVTITLSDAPIENEPPVAEFNYSPVYPVTGDEVYFNASESYDPEGGNLRYLWDFGDGETGGGKKVMHIFDVENLIDQTFTVTLTVIDDEDASASISYPVLVYGKSPRNGH